MSWFNQVKFFYTSTITLLITFIWAVITSIVFKVEISFQLFFLVILMSNIGRYYFRKGINPKLCLALAMIPIVIIELLTSFEPFFAVLNIVFSTFVMEKLFKEEKNDINYDEYKRLFLHGLYYMFAAGIIYSLMKWSGFAGNSSMIYIGILVYIILAVISLREAMGFEYQIKRTRGSKCINYGLALFGILLTQKRVYGWIIFLGEIISRKVGDLISWVATIIFSIIQYPLMWLFSLLQKLLGDGKGEFPDVMANLDSINTENFTERVGGTGTLIINVIVFFIIIVIIYLLYKGISKVYYQSNKNKTKEYTESVEKLEVEKTKARKISTLLKKLFRKKGTPREEVIYKYGEFVTTASKKEIFKEYMTPGQLKNIIKIKVDSSNHIDDITNIYNEAKFSTHNIEEGQKNIVEENVNKVSKKMK